MERPLPPKVDFAEGAAEVRYVLACPNPDCPSNESALARASDGQF